MCKRFFCYTLAIVLLAGGSGIGCRKDAERTTGTEKASAKTSAPTALRQPSAPFAKTPAPVDPRGKKARLLTSRGILEMELFADEAPLTVANFIRLAQSGFYNGVRFHRVEPGTLLQTGDPTGRGSGGAGWTIPFEKNRRRHLIGSVAMARDDDKNSASSQFYICLRSLPELDGEDTVFGRITAGFEVLPQIVQNDVVERVEIVPTQP